MAGRGVIAVTTPGGFLGVVHDLECEPWHLGNALLVQLLDREGDLAGLVADLVFRAPGGWRSFPDAERRPPSEDPDEPQLYGPDELRHQAWVAWLYLIDVAAGRITVYAGNPYLRPDTRLAPLARVTVAADGAAQPPVFAQPPPPWPGLPVTAAWDQDEPSERRVRARLDRALSGPDGGAALRKVLSDLFLGLIEAADWQEPLPLESTWEQTLRGRLEHPRTDPRRRALRVEDPLCVPFNWDNSDSYWQVELGEQPVRYPPASLRSLSDPLRLYRLDGTHAVIKDIEDRLRAAARADAQPSTALQRFGRSLAFWKSDHDEKSEAVDTFVDTLVMARGGTAGLHWWMLDWLRMGAVELPEADAAPVAIGSVLPTDESMVDKG